MSESKVRHLVDELQRANEVYGQLWERLSNLDIAKNPEEAARLEQAFRRVERDRRELRDRLLGRHPAWFPASEPAGGIR